LHVYLYSPFGNDSIAGLHKAEYGMGMPYDAERVAELRHMLRDARKRKLSQGLAARRGRTSDER
jgi:hypothetical protein